MGSCKILEKSLLSSAPTAARTASNAKRALGRRAIATCLTGFPAYPTTTHDLAPAPSQEVWLKKTHVVSRLLDISTKEIADLVTETLGVGGRPVVFVICSFLVLNGGLTAWTGARYATPDLQSGSY
jgi:hypothetical protein